jgi:hypothetical protein
MTGTLAQDVAKEDRQWLLRCAACAYGVRGWLASLSRESIGPMYLVCSQPQRQAQQMLVASGCSQWSVVLLKISRLCCQQCCSIMVAVSVHDSSSCAG